MDNKDQRHSFKPLPAARVHAHATPHTAHLCRVRCAAERALKGRQHRNTAARVARHLPHCAVAAWASRSSTGADLCALFTWFGTDVLLCLALRCHWDVPKTASYLVPTPFLSWRTPSPSYLLKLRFCASLVRTLYFNACPAFRLACLRLHCRAGLRRTAD